MGQMVLVIEDDRQLLRTIGRTLTGCGFRVHCTALGRQGLRAVARCQADLVLLDLTLPDMDGLDVITEIRAQSRVPLLVLSGRHEEEHKIAALNAGADSYITKPFSFDELEARVRAALRPRPRHTADEPELQLDGLVIDLSRRVVKLAGQTVHLAPIEFRLLAELAKNAGRITTHRTLLLAIWGPEHAQNAHNLRVHMSNLRKKIEQDPLRPRYIITEPTMGYRLTLD